MLLGLSCSPPALDLDAGSTPPEVWQRDAGNQPEPYDPCVWDGSGDGLCFADTAVVFDGTECRVVCGARPAPGVPGVFASTAECRSTCPCNPEKFVMWPQGAAGPLAPGGHCDSVEAVTDGGAAVPWPAEACTTGPLWGDRADQSCTTDVRGDVHGYLDRRAMAAACRASALPQVRQLVCVLWVD